MAHQPAREEHQIFVKHVPRYLAETSVTAYFKQHYNPLDIRNVYPQGYNTTLVISFGTAEQAVAVQSDTNGLRLDGIVLQVESYARARSVRALRHLSEHGQPYDSNAHITTRRAAGYVSGANVRVGRPRIPPSVAVAGPSVPVAPEAMGHAWPTLAEQQEQRVRLQQQQSARSRSRADQSRRLAGAQNQGKQIAPRAGMAIAVPHIPAYIQADDALSGDTAVEKDVVDSEEKKNAASPALVPALALAPVLVEKKTEEKDEVKTQQGTVKQEVQEEEDPKLKPKPKAPTWQTDSLFSPYENMTTAQRIHRNHAHNCSFCQLHRH